MTMTGRKPGAKIPALAFMLALSSFSAAAPNESPPARAPEVASRMAPIHSGALDPVGRKLFELGNFGEAAEHYRSQILREPDNPGACLGLGLALCYSGDYREAMKSFDDCLSRMPEQADLYMARGLCVQAVEGVASPRAEADYVQALALDAGNFSAHNQLGLIHQARGRHQAAISQFQAAIKSDPAGFEAYNNLAVSLMEVGRYDEAIYVLQKAISMKEDLNGVFLYTNLGIAFLISGRPAHAEAAFLMETAINPGHPPAHLYLGNLYSMSGRRQEAVSEYRRALTLDPVNRDALINLGVTLLEAGRPRMAVAQLQRAVELHPDSAAAHYQLARAYAAIGETRKAEIERQKALELGFQEQP